MKKYLLPTWVLLFISSCFISSAQSGNVRLKASVKTSTDEIIPTAYVKIYPPGDLPAIDSLFSDEQGKIERNLPFTYTSSSSAFSPRVTGLIIKPISPNIISQKTTNYTIEYNYVGDANLFFTDLRGRIYPNHSELSSGLYFYFIRFADGNQSEIHKLVVAETTRLSVNLINVKENNKKQEVFFKASADLKSFYLEIIKDGFINLRDTIAIDSAILERNYRLDAAPIPTASFTFTGNLEVGRPVIFNASSSVGAGGEPLDYSWDFGNGKRGGTVQIPHLYSFPGEYNVRLIVTGEYGAKDSITQSLIIQKGASTDINSGNIYGFITDENLTELGDVMVSLVEGENSGSTDTKGTLSLTGLPVGIPIHLKLIKDGYVNQIIKVTIPDEAKEAHFFSTLKSRKPVLTLPNAEFGGKLEGVDGTVVTLPVEAFVKPDGSPVRGNVNAYITPVDVAFETAAFPGTFQAFREDGENGVLLSYGVSEFYFGQDDEALQLAPGKKAMVLIPIYTSGAVLGDQIPLWSVNEDNGIWVQEGTGTVVESESSPTGLALKAEVNHFSWFNCDVFEEDRKRKGLCYRWECTSSICVKVKVGCWMSGARRETTGARKNLSDDIRYKSTEEERDTIPPVFEVRDFIPEDGKILNMPNTSDVYIEARGFDNEGKLFEGSFTLLATQESDSFEIELKPVITRDTSDLPLNLLSNYYLQAGEYLPFRVNIPAKNDYRLYFNGGSAPALKGVFMVSDATGVISTGNINLTNNYITLWPGEVIITISGLNQLSEGNFVLGIAEPELWLPGDTLDIVMSNAREEYLDQGEFLHFRTNITEKNLYKIDVRRGVNPYLNGRFKVEHENNIVYSGLMDNKSIYLTSEIGRMIVSVAGKSLTDKGNINMEISPTDVIPIALNDSIYDSIATTVETRIYKIESNKNTMLRARFYYTESTGGTRQLRIFSSSGQVLGSSSIYLWEDVLLLPMIKDSAYFIELNGKSETEYVLITEEDEQYNITYGDTMENSLKYRKDKNLHHFTGREGDLVSIRGSQPDYTLNKGSFILLAEDGTEIARREIHVDKDYYDHEILYKLPSDGRYSILVESADNTAGDYQIILDTVAYTSLNMDALTELDVSAKQCFYFELECTEERISHISLISDGGSGTFALWSARCERLNLLNSYRYYSSTYNANYTGKFKTGKYYLKLEAVSASRIFINFAGATPLNLNSKGETLFTDTIVEANKINAYYFSGGLGDGIHAIINKADELSVPGKIELKYYQPSGDGTPLIINWRNLNHYSLDSTILNETAGKLDGTKDDSTWVIIAYAETPGIYECRFHHVASNISIIADDDYAQYPDAQTSSVIAAGYALGEFGNLLIANGEYSSYLPLEIKSNYVTLEGQEKENVLLRNMYNTYDNPSLYYQAIGGRISNLSISCGNLNYWGLKAYGENMIIENIEIKPLVGRDIVSGGIKGGGNNMVLRNIFLNHSMWGIEIGSDNGLIENCELITENQAIQLVGENTMVRNNKIVVNANTRAIAVKSGLGTGNQVVENNLITMNFASKADDNGVIGIEKSGVSANATYSYIRNNKVYNATGSPGIYAGIGNPPSGIIVESNQFFSTNSIGSKGIRLSSIRADGSSSIIVRNNIFDGLRSIDAIEIYGTDGVKKNKRFAIYNNNFRILDTAPKDSTNNFIRVNTFYSNVTDTLNLYIANNIFEGNGFSYFAKCQYNFLFYSDYNIVYNFRKYLGNLGSIIGMTHDITTDPLYIDNELRIGPGSPAINTGASPALFELIPEVDMEGVRRPQGPGYDIGAYEKLE